MTVELATRRCIICGSDNTATVQIRGYLFGGHQSYYYRKCNSCISLILENGNTAAVETIYDEEYPSFTSPARKSGRIRKLLRSLRNRIVLSSGTSLLAKGLLRVKPLPYEFRAVGEYARASSAILDVGCGSGTYLRELSDAGFTNLLGVDPYLPNEFEIDSTLTLKRQHIEQVAGRFDVILSHHSLEHAVDPRAMLKAIATKLNTSGVAIITIPVLGNLFKVYGCDSYILQAPQHTNMLSITAMILLAHNSGLDLIKLHRGSEFRESWIETSQKWSELRLTSKQTKDYSGEATAPDNPSASAAALAYSQGDNVTFIFEKARH